MRKCKNVISGNGADVPLPAVPLRSKGTSDVLSLGNCNANEIAPSRSEDASSTEMYRFVANELALLAKVPASVNKFCRAMKLIEKSFVSATQPLDADLSDNNFLAAAFELVLEDPLSAEGNNWKRSLTVLEASHMQTSFALALGAMVRWAQAMQSSDPLADASQCGGFVQSIRSIFFTPPYLVRNKETNTQRIVIPRDILLKYDKCGNAVYNSKVVQELKRGCKIEGAIKTCQCQQLPDEASYEQRLKIVRDICLCEYDNHKAFELYFRTLEDARQYLDSRFRIFSISKDSSVKAQSLMLSPFQDGVFTFLLTEYCTPIFLRAKDEDTEELERYTDAIQGLVLVLDIICDMVYRASGRSREALRAKMAWGELRALFAQRAFTLEQPPYRKQEMFFNNLLEFREIFNAGVETIKNAPPDAMDVDVAQRNEVLETLGQVADTLDYFRQKCIERDNTELEEIINRRRKGIERETDRYNATPNINDIELESRDGHSRYIIQLLRDVNTEVIIPRKLRLRKRRNRSHEKRKVIKGSLPEAMKFIRFIIEYYTDESSCDSDDGSSDPVNDDNEGNSGDKDFEFEAAVEFLHRAKTADMYIRADLEREHGSKSKKNINERINARWRSYVKMASKSYEPTKIMRKEREVLGG